MSDFVSLINKNSPNVRNTSIIGSYFEKSHVVDSLVYNEDMKLQKTGKEIKSQIETVKSNCEQEKNKYYQDMMIYQKQVGIAPTCNFDEYETKGLYERIGEVKKYGYDQRYPNSNVKELDSAVSNSYQQENNTITDEQKQAMDNYNTAARKYIQYSVDIIVLNTLSKNLSDNKKISLNVKQAALLGF
jgi:hypothetical protein